MKGAPEELLGDICPCSCAERQANPPPIEAKLLAPQGISLSVDNTLLMEFGPCTIGTPRLDVSIYQSDYDDVSEWGGFTSLEYADIYLNGEKVKKCNPSGKDCSLHKCIEGMDVTKYIVNNTLDVRIVNSQDVNANGCDGEGGLGDYWLAADMKLTGCLREIVYGDAERGDDICYDCSGIGLGPNRADQCGECDDNPFNDCQEDCFGVWGGPSIVDECGVCNGTDICADCAGVAFGRKQADHCGDCDANPADDCASDCAGAWGGTSVRDSCDVCTRQAGLHEACAHDSSELTGVYTFYGVCEPSHFLNAMSSVFAYHFDGAAQPTADMNVEVFNYSMAIEGLIKLPFNPTAAMVTSDSVVQLKSTLSVLLELDPSVIEVYDAVDFTNQVCDFRYVVTMATDVSARFNLPVFKTQMARNARRAILLGNPQMAIESNINIDEGDIEIPDVQVTSIYDFVVAVRSVDPLINETIMTLTSDDGFLAAAMNTFIGIENSVTGGSLAVSNLQFMDFDCAGRIRRLPSPWLMPLFLESLGDDPDTAQVRMDLSIASMYINLNLILFTAQATGRWPVDYDACGVCGGENDEPCLGKDEFALNMMNSRQGDGGCVDCNGVAFGPASMDNCGMCDAISSNDCRQDCVGVWGGDGAYDACGVCDGLDACMDCAFAAGGHAYVDNCEICDDNRQNDCVPSKCAALRNLPFYPTYETVPDCTLTSSWGYEYDFSAYSGLHTVPNEEDGSQLSFNLCGGVPVSALPLQYRSSCYVPPPPPPPYRAPELEPEPEPDWGPGPFGPWTPAIQTPEVADRVFVTGFDCPDWLANPFGDPKQWYSLSYNVNGKPHWVSDSGRWHIYYLESNGLWYLDNDLTVVAPDDFTQGFWGFIPAADLLMYPTAGFDNAPHEAEDGILQGNPVGAFSKWREYLLRGTFLHNKSHNLHLILSLNYAYVFPGLGTAVATSKSGRSTWTRVAPPLTASGTALRV